MKCTHKLEFCREFVNSQYANIKIQSKKKGKNNKKGAENHYESKDLFQLEPQ